jgi:hypothetical protein
LAGEERGTGGGVAEDTQDGAEAVAEEKVGDLEILLSKKQKQLFSDFQTGTEKGERHIGSGFRESGGHFSCIGFTLIVFYGLSK